MAGKKGKALTKKQKRNLQSMFCDAELALYSFEKALRLVQRHKDDAHFDLLHDAWEHLRDPMKALGLENRYV